MVITKKFVTNLGIVTVSEEAGALILCSFSENPLSKYVGETGDTPLLRETQRQIEEYLRGERRRFDVTLRLIGTPFQKRVWEALGQIPYGETRSYGDIARAIGAPRACRAVGMANHANPLMLFVPCHRVIAADGSLGGFAAGSDLKTALLKLEDHGLRAATN